MNTFPEGRAIVYCQDSFTSTVGKTAHGLVRRTERYTLLAVVDRMHVGRDAGDVLEGRPRGIPFQPDVATAVTWAREKGTPATHLVIGLAPDGGRLAPDDRAAVRTAIDLGLNVDSGLHDFLADDPELAELARARKVTLRDVRRTPPRSDLHGFTGKIQQVRCQKVALLGTDSAVGKRTTAWFLVEALRAAGRKAELIGTGQTAWLQGARFGILLDSLINDFVAGELEHAVWRAWTEARPDVVVVEGQGSLMNPAYPGGLEILAATRPDLIFLQHAPSRREYDGFPGHPMHPLPRQIQALELISEKPVAAIVINQEGLDATAVRREQERIREETGLPVVVPLLDGVGVLVDVLEKRRAG